MAFNLTAKTIIESVTLELSGGELVELAGAAPHFHTLMEFANESKNSELVQAVSWLTLVDSLLASIEKLVGQGGIIKSRRGGKPKANPTTG